MSLQNLKIAIVCDWLTNLGGAERVIAAFHHMFPKAPIYTTLYDSKEVSILRDADIRTSFLQKLPRALHHHQWYIKCMPYIFENFDLNEYDIVLSSSHACSKGVITKPMTLHICYCHSPMRYVWDEWQQYIRQYRLGEVFQRMIMWSFHKLRMWDRLASERVDSYIANSSFVAQRIEKYYRRSAHVIHPPVDTDFFGISDHVKDFFLAVGRLVPYKRFDLVVDAFNELGFPLKICGNGPEFSALKSRALGNIEFLGNVSDTNLADLYASCRAFVFPQCEDFGIVPLEAMASGRPVIAYGAGGALETVRDGKTGVFFSKQTVSSLKDAVLRFRKMKFDPAVIRKHAEKFSKPRFEKEMLSFIHHEWRKYTSDETFESR